MQNNNYPHQIDNPNLADLDEISLDQNNAIDVNLVDDLGRTPLIHASRNGDTAQVQLLLNNGANVNHIDNHGNSALIYASGRGHTGVVELLTNNDANLEFRNNDGYTALAASSTKGMVATTKLLIEKGAYLNSAENRKATALMMASQQGHKAIAELFIDHEADLALVDNRDHTALHHAFSSNKNIEVARLLLNKGVDVAENLLDAVLLTTLDLNSNHEIFGLLIFRLLSFFPDNAVVNFVDNFGQTPLIYASISGNIAQVQLLLNHGANSNQIDDGRGWSALIHASNYGHIGVIQLLLNNNANLELRNGLHNTALVCASISGQLESVKTLVDRGANVNSVNNDNCSALKQAITKKHENIAMFLIKNNANIELRDSKGFTALASSSLNGLVATTELLIEKGAYLNSAANRKVTALMMASQLGHKAIVELFIGHEADLGLVDNKGHTALHHTCFINGNNIELASLLLNEGVDVAENLLDMALQASPLHPNPDYEMANLLIFRLLNFRTDSDFDQRILTLFLKSGYSSTFTVGFLTDLGFDRDNLSKAYIFGLQDEFNTLVSHDANIYQLQIPNNNIHHDSLDHTLNVMRGIHACRELVESIPIFNYYIEHVLGLPFTLPAFMLQLSFRIPAHFATNYAVTFYVKGLALGILDLQPLKHSLTYAASTVVNELILPQTYDQNIEINSINQFISQCTLPSLSGAFFGYMLSSLSPNNLPTIFGAIKGGTTAALQCYSAHKITHLEKSDDYLVKYIDILVGTGSAMSVVAPYVNYDGKFIKYYEFSFVIHNMVLADIFLKTNIDLIKNSMSVIGDSVDQASETLVETLGSIKTNVENYLFADYHEEL